jgi:pyruvate ferredoxin oxidoreductase delta subunit
MKFRCDLENDWFKAGKILGQPVSGWRYSRPVMDLTKCNSCGWCFLYCPTGCISEDGEFFLINLDYCKGCGICVNECPKKAIQMVNEEAK